MESCCHNKLSPRDEELIKSVDNRINRVIGQLNGIKKMIEDNRYCGDILIQLSAVQSALQNVGQIIFEDHMESCVVEKIKSGDKEIISETLELVKRLK